MVLFDEPLTINPMDVMRDESTWTSILRPDEVPIPFSTFTTAEMAESHDPKFHYQTPSFQHLSNVLNCSGFQLTESEQAYLLSAIEGTKPAPRVSTTYRRPSASSYAANSVLSGRIYKPRQLSNPQPRRPSSQSLSLHSPRTPSDQDQLNPFASLAPVHHSIGPKEIPRFYGMRMTAQECDLLETMLGESTNSVAGSSSSDSSEKAASSPMPSLSWSEGEEMDSVSPADVFGNADHLSHIAGISIPSDEDDEDEPYRQVSGKKRNASAPTVAPKTVSMDGEQKEKYEPEIPPIRAYSWKGKMASSRRSSAVV